MIYAKVNDRKKHRSFEDGVLVLDGKSAVLLDDDGKQLAKERDVKFADMKAGQTLKVGMNDCEVVQEVPAAEFASGRRFLPAPAPAAAAACGAGGAGCLLYTSDAADE